MHTSTQTQVQQVHTHEHTTKVDKRTSTNHKQTPTCHPHARVQTDFHMLTVRDARITEWLRHMHISAQAAENDAHRT